MLTYEHLVVATDFSDSARPALKGAAALARRLGARVDLVHVFIPGVYASAVDTTPEALEEGMRGASLNLLTELRKELFGGVEVETFALAAEHEAFAIVDHAKERGADLCVVGTHGRRGLRRVLTGSVASAVVRHAHCDVLVVPQDAPIDLSANVVAATDLSEASRRALHAAVRLADGPPHVLHVVVPVGGVVLPVYFTLRTSTSDYEDPDRATLRAMDRLHATCREVLAEREDPRQGPTQLGPMPACEVLIDESPAEAMRGYVKDNQVTLLVVGTHGRTGLRRLLLGSVAETIVRQPPCALLIARS